jgi:squalene-hopene/tetraprenyl-beta-curcumene cyclase
MTVTHALGETADGGSRVPVTDAAREALVRARDHLLSLQHELGWWQGELETNVTMDAEDLLMRQFLGAGDASHTAAEARWIRSQQRDDGTWANFYGGPGDLSTTIEAYVALRLAGDLPAAPHMAQAAQWIRAQGGLAASRVFTRIWLAMFGEWPWDELPVIPPELIYLPAWFPLNIYDWGCWARQTIVALAIVSSQRPVRKLPFSLPELHTGATPGGRPSDPWAKLFDRLDEAMHTYERRTLAGPAQAVRRAALRRCADWIIARQERDGCWGGIQPPWVYSLIGLHLLGYRLDHPVVARGLAGLDRFTVKEDTPQGPVHRLEACQSPVWDTVLVMVGLEDAGLPPDHPALVRAAQWVLGEEVPGPGDWQMRRPDLAPGGWSFEFDNDYYPDTDDTAEAILALRRVALPGSADGRPGARPAIDRAVQWLNGMQSKNGAWGAFDADNTREIVTKLPFCDFGAVIDPPSADVTAHIVEALAAEGLAASRPVRRGVVWLLRNQEPDGSWFGRWGANYIYGTGAAVPALIAAGVLPSKPAIRRAVAWLVAHQNPDGGWGEDLRSYEDPALAGRGASTASQTAWALLALLAAGGATEAVERGIGWLAATQRADGSWDEPQFTGTGFPGDFYINYHLYRLAFPVSALGRYVRGAQAGLPARQASSSGPALRGTR